MTRLMFRPFALVGKRVMMLPSKEAQMAGRFGRCAALIVVTGLCQIAWPATAEAASPRPLQTLSMRSSGGKVTSREGIVVRLKQDGHKISRRGDIPMWGLSWRAGKKRGKLRRVGRRWHAELRVGDRIVRIRDGRKRRLRVEFFDATGLRPLSQRRAYRRAARVARRLGADEDSSGIEGNHGAWVCTFERPDGSDQVVVIGRWTGARIATWIEPAERRPRRPIEHDLPSLAGPVTRTKAKGASARP